MTSECCKFGWPLTLLKQEAAVIKTGVAGRINDWLNKTPESGKTSGGKPTVGHCQEISCISNPAQWFINRIIYTSMLRENCSNQLPAVGYDNPHIHSRGTPLVSRHRLHYITKDFNRNDIFFFFFWSIPFSFFLSCFARELSSCNI